MDNQREKLIELIRYAPKVKLPFGGRANGKEYQTAGSIADHILADEEVKHAFELLKAEKEGRLIETPCKVGTRVYRIVPDHLVTYPDPAEYTIIWDTFKLNDIYTFGKTVFLSREEAEKALEERKDK